MTALCLCSHVQGLHDKDAAGDRTWSCYVPGCGCSRFRLDPRSRPNPVQDEQDAATGKGSAA